MNLNKKVVFNITMGTQKIRKKRRRRFRKPNPLIVILASMTIILLFIWGGLHFKESSEKTQIDVQTNGKDRSQTSQLGMNLVPEEEQLISDVMGESIETSDDQKEVGGESLSQSPNESEKKKENGTQSDTLPPKSSGTADLTQPKPESEQQNNTKNNMYITPTTKPDSSSKVDSDSSNIGQSGKQTDVVVTTPQKYEQEMIKIEANCRKDMNVVLSKAENSIQKMDKGNLVSVQSWRENTTNEIATAESSCDAIYQDLIRNAEKDAIPTSVINEWKQTYNTLKVGLQDESRAKMQRLMGV